MKRAIAPLIVIFVVLAGLVWIAQSLFDHEPVVKPVSIAKVPQVPQVPVNPAPAEAVTAAPTTTPVREEEKPAPPVVPPSSDFPDQGPPGSIVGRVLSPNGDPAAGAEVELARGPAAGLNLQTLRTPTGLVIETDENGNYRFSEVAPNDDYLVIASHPDFGD